MHNRTPNRPLPGYTESNTFEYLRVVRQHIIQPLRDTAVADSCFAAALLIFGAVDGLGRLFHESPKAGAGERFRFFAARLGKRYVRRNDALWKLRNGLAHNGMNNACFMSKVEAACGKHLEECDGYLFVHTRELLRDFEVALSQLEKELEANPSLLERAESRLSRTPIYSRASKEYPTTKPAPVEFVEIKRRVPTKQPPAILPPDGGSSHAT